MTPIIGVIDSAKTGNLATYFFETNSRIYNNGTATDSALNIYSGGGGTGVAQLQKIDAKGDITFTRSYGKPTDTSFSFWVGTSVNTTGNVSLSGFSSMTAAPGQRRGLIGYTNTDGSLAWSRQFYPSNVNQDLQLYSNAIDSSGNIYVTGFSSPSNNAMPLVKYNSSGTIQWQREFGINGSQAGGSFSYVYGNSSLVVDSTGANVYLVGATDFVANSRRGILMKVNSSGTIQWQRYFYGLNNGGGMANYAIARDSSDNLYVMWGGIRTSTTGGYQILFIAKYNSSGTLQWQRKYTPPGISADVDYAGMTCDTNGNVYAVAVQTTTTYPNRTAFLLAYNSSGVLQWQRYIRRSTNIDTYFWSVNVNGNVLTVGPTQVSSGVAFLRIPTDGSKTGTYTFDGASWAYGPASGTDAAGDCTDAAGGLPTTTTTYTDATVTFASDTTVSATNTKLII